MKPDQQTKDDVLRLSHQGWQENDVAYILHLRRSTVKKILRNPDTW